MTEDQRYFRKRAREESTKCVQSIRKSWNWRTINTNREGFWTGTAAYHAKQAASFAFKAHPELRTPEGETICR